ncbi:MAG TPA: hypothetical protein VEJ41_09910 [Candidatus Acidoferrales bacterium]|nr:hypothetical protein [Candidatus Acidoferrales bacterium]
MLALLLRLKFFWGLRGYAMRLGRLFIDRRVSPTLKVFAGLAALVAVSPLDLLGDVPILGAIDDVALLALIAALFVRFCPRDAVAEHFGPVPTLKNVTPH